MQASNNWWYLGDGDFLMTNPTPQANSSFYIFPDPSEAPFATDRSDAKVNAAWGTVVPNGLGIPQWTEVSGLLATLRDKAIARRLSAKPLFVVLLQLALTWQVSLAMVMDDKARESFARLYSRLQGNNPYTPNN